ncbi:MAG: S4 domain-containing protein, partial [Kistimonas sp.]|nr:S4 domain-containing protein [Kistimonas sp.]
MTETQISPPSNNAEHSQGERLHKVLARCGFGSRREIEGWIEQGRVQVNGKVAAQGMCLQARDQVRLDGRPLAWQE